MALTQISTDGIKDGTITGADLATNVDLVDNKKIRFGTGNDLEIYHNGTASFISNTTGDLKIDSDNIKIRQSNGNAFIKCQSTAVELYYADNKKFETNSEGVRINGFLEMLDNQRIQMGDGDDLQIYHNGSESWIRNSTGTLNVLNDGVFQFKNLADNETIAQFEADGACSLYYNNSKKFETTASGVDVTGNCTITGNFRGNDGVMLNLGNGDDLQIYHDGSDDRIMSGSTNSTIFASKYLRIMNQAANETMAKFFENGAVELNYDNSKKFETTNLGAQVTGRLNVSGNFEQDDGVKANWGNSHDLQIYHDGAHSYIENSTGSFFIKGDTIKLRGKSADEDLIEAFVNGSVRLYYNNDKKAHTYADGFQTKLLTPMADDTYNMGTSALRWVKLYAASGSIGTSDRNEKNTIVESDLGLSFINKLKPVSYKWNNTNNDTATHYGLIAQDIEEAIKSEGKTLEDFGAIEKPDNAPMGLGYSELISPLIKAVQELSAEVAALKAS